MKASTTTAGWRRSTSLVPFVPANLNNIWKVTLAFWTQTTFEDLHLSILQRGCIHPSSIHKRLYRRACNDQQCLNIVWFTSVFLFFVIDDEKVSWLSFNWDGWSSFGLKIVNWNLFNITVLFISWSTLDVYSFSVKSPNIQLYMYPVQYFS